MDEIKLNKLLKKINYRDRQINLLYNLLVKNENLVYSLLHLFGLSGTGKTFLIKKFMNKFCHNSELDSTVESSLMESDLDTTSTNVKCPRRYYIYLNCNELCYSSVSILFNEIIERIKRFLTEANLNTTELAADTSINVSFSNANNQMNTSNVDMNESIDDYATTMDRNDSSVINDFSIFIRKLRQLLTLLTRASAANRRTSSSTIVYFVFDNSDRLKLLNESSSLILSLTKLNEYINMGSEFQSLNVKLSCIFISEIDWHSLISDWDLMSKTECPRPFIIYFNDYTKDEMNLILSKTASSLVRATNGPNDLANSDMGVKFYSKIILDVFYPICKDLNEIQYLIQIYYDQLINQISSDEAQSNPLTFDKMLAAWNKMKPFLKQALTQIYLRQSMHENRRLNEKYQTAESSLSRVFENLNILNDKNMPGVANTNANEMTTNETLANQLPRLMKYLLISAYVATHNPAKYDKKLFDYNTGGKSRKSRFTAQRFQQNEENQHSAALKTQSFDLNRLMAIFFAVCAENFFTSSSNETTSDSAAINLSQIQLNIKTLKSLHYIQQTNSTYSGLDEPRYKCLIDFETILALSNSVQFNLKQYLAEYITL